MTLKIPTEAPVPGGEIVSPKLSGTLGFKVLKAICDGCTAANVDVMLRRRNYAGEVTTVTSAAGLHVHVNGRMLTRRQLARLAHIYTDATPVIRSIMPQRRQNEYYCQDLCDEELERIDRGDINYIDRYRTVKVRNYVDTNATEHRPRGTVEFRQHNGTIEYQAIANWVRLLFCMRRAAIDGRTVDNTSLSAYLTSLGCEGRTIEYYMRRQQRVARRARAS
jgi:hypothetical protein